MKKTIVFMSIGLAGLTLKASGSQGQLKANGSQGKQTRAEPLPATSFTITLGGRDACVDPVHADLDRGSRWRKMSSRSQPGAGGNVSGNGVLLRAGKAGRKIGPVPTRGKSRRRHPLNGRLYSEALRRML